MMHMYCKKTGADSATSRPRERGNCTSIGYACGLRMHALQAQERDMKSGGQKGMWKKGGGKKPFSRRN